MAKSAKSVEAAIAQLELLRANASAPESIEALKFALSNTSNLVAAKAANVARDAKLVALTPNLAATFARFMRDPAKTDRGCAAKQAAAEALYELGASEAEVFLAGARHVQLEGSWGPPVDTAAQLRGVCLLGLVRVGHPRQLEVLAEHLMDKEAQVRLVAARAAGYAANDTAALLLRMKVLAGDVEPEITAECFVQLVKLQPARSLEFVEHFIDSPDATIRQSALLAIGASRQPDALRMLTDRWESSFAPEARAMLIPAIAAHRSNEAIEFLIDRLDNAGPDLASAIVEGMEMFRHDDAIRARLKAITDARGDAKLSGVFARRFSV